MKKLLKAEESKLKVSKLNQVPDVASAATARQKMKIDLGFSSVRTLPKKPIC